MLKGLGNGDEETDAVASSSVSSLTYLPCVPVKLLCVTKVVGAPTLL